MRNALRGLSLSFTGYVLLLLGFVFLGSFVTAAATGITAAAWGCGVAMVIAYALSVAAFRFQIRESEDTRANDELIVYTQPLIPSMERERIDAYEQTYHHRELTHA